jgi:cob(I)alamin adenosyltransferase
VAIRITRVYTRRGDRGETDLVGGPRAAKDSPRIAAFGTVDELNAALGTVRAFNAAEIDRAPACAELDGILRRVQSECFDLGAQLATPPEAWQPGMFELGDQHVAWLEQQIDRCQQDLQPLNSFILPGGGRTSALLHVARTVCRRAEREVLALSRVEPVGEWALRYLNRLSDLFFVLGRWAGKHMGEKEHLWERGLSAHTRRR